MANGKRGTSFDAPAFFPQKDQPVSILGKNIAMNNIIYIVGLVVIVIFVLGFFGLR